MSYKIIVTPVNIKEKLVINETYIASVVDVISTIQAPCDVTIEAYKDGRWQTHKKYKLNQGTNNQTDINDLLKENH